MNPMITTMAPAMSPEAVLYAGLNPLAASLQRNGEERINTARALYAEKVRRQAAIEEAARRRADDEAMLGIRLAADMKMAGERERAADERQSSLFVQQAEMEDARILRDERRKDSGAVAMWQKQLRDDGLSMPAQNKDEPDNAYANRLSEAHNEFVKSSTAADARLLRAKLKERDGLSEAIKSPVDESLVDAHLTLEGFKKYIGSEKAMEIDEKMAKKKTGWWPLSKEQPGLALSEALRTLDLDGDFNKYRTAIKSALQSDAEKSAIATRNKLEQAERFIGHLSQKRGVYDAYLGLEEKEQDKASVEKVDQIHPLGSLFIQPPGASIDLKPEGRDAFAATWNLGGQPAAAQAASQKPVPAITQRPPTATTPDDYFDALPPDLKSAYPDAYRAVIARKLGIGQHHPALQIGGSTQHRRPEEAVLDLARGKKVAGLPSPEELTLFIQSLSPEDKEAFRKSALVAASRLPVYGSRVPAGQESRFTPSSPWSGQGFLRAPYQPTLSGAEAALFVQGNEAEY